MSPLQIMLVAGETSGDLLAAELVRALRPVLPGALGARCGNFAPRFFGAGGPAMSEAGVELELDLTAHAVFGLSESLRRVAKFARIFRRLFELALYRQPDAIVLVDYAGFNRRFAAAIKRHVRSRRGAFYNWDPLIVYYVSPQVWASRPGRAHQLARDVDLMLSILPFEGEWYARHVPQLPVQFVGHPIIDRHATAGPGKRPGPGLPSIPSILLLPGSRAQELRRHLPVMIEAMHTVIVKRAVRLRMILPRPELAALARRYTQGLTAIEVRCGELGPALVEAEVAVVSSGTATLECAYFGVPAVVLYRASWATYLVARQLAQVRYMAMPNLLANEPIYPEFLQAAATPDNVAAETLDLLMNEPRREHITRRLQEVIGSLGPPGAAARAAQAIARLLAASGLVP